MSSRAADAFGDFQTPVDLARKVWTSLPVDGVRAVIEPTVGTGAFLAAAPKEMRGVMWRCFDIRAEYVDRTAGLVSLLGLDDVQVEVRDAFDVASEHLADLNREEPVLAIGNPPWVTSSEQGRMGAKNLPQKKNDGFALSGLDALTGKSNFDIAEAILLRLLQALADFRDVRLAFLVKRSVAMKIAKRLLGVAEALSFSRIDAARWFGVSVDAGVFYAQIVRPAVAPVASVDLAEQIGALPSRRAGMYEGEFVEDLDAHARVAGFSATSSVPWRQGIKHDVARILELRLLPDGRLINGLDVEVDVESEVLVPLYKGSDVARGRGPSRLFPLYQIDLAGPDVQLDRKWPRLARYLRMHRYAFEARRSRIYRGKHPFFLFGVGPYLAAPWKVVICGLYRSPVFRVLGPADGRPAVVDDTCYLLPYPDEESAATVAAHLNDTDAQQLIASLVDGRAKRPFTKAVLSRVAVPVVPGLEEKADAQLALLQADG